MNLKGKVVALTGGASGIGLAAVEGFAAAGGLSSGDGSKYAEMADLPRVPFSPYRSGSLCEYMEKILRGMRHAQF